MLLLVTLCETDSTTLDLLMACFCVSTWLSVCEWERQTDRDRDREENLEITWLRLLLFKQSDFSWMRLQTEPGSSPMELSVTETSNHEP